MHTAQNTGALEKLGKCTRHSQMSSNMHATARTHWTSAV